MEAASSAASSSTSSTTTTTTATTTTTIIGSSSCNSSRSKLEYDMEKTQALDMPLHSIGFVFGDLTPHRVTGHMRISSKCVQPFRVLHGGVSALIAEGMASVGAHMASGFQRVAGIHLSINHHKTATVGDFIRGVSTPISVGKTIQVWEVRLYKVDASKPNTTDPNSWKEEDEGKSQLIASSKVTLLCNLPVPDNSIDASQILRKYSRL